MSDISVNDLIDSVREVENDIKAAVIPILAEFQTTTGLSFSSIWFDLVNVTTVGDAYPDYMLNKVSCELALRE